MLDGTGRYHVGGRHTPAAPSPCYVAVPRPARSYLPRVTATHSCGAQVAESALLAAPNRARHFWRGAC
jgi:hypothetical protein